VRKLFAVLAIATSALANEVSVHSLQSGSPSGPTPVWDHGIHGEGQIVAVIDTGVDYNSCYFAEPDDAPPPFNTGSPNGGLDWENVDLARRKIIAYDFLYSCDQYPNAPGCDAPFAAGALDNQGHGTHAAGSILGDKGAPIVHDYGDAVAPGAKLIVQDTGFRSSGDACTQLTGVGCPAKLLPILEQAYKQGARIHSNSWGDRQGVPNGLPAPTANYSTSARDVDAFVWAHPDSLVLFNTGNWSGGNTDPPLSSLSAPGVAKNTIQVGGSRGFADDDASISNITLFGPSRDGRIKPDLIGPASVIAGDMDFDQNPATCDVTRQPGTSFASPTIAGAAALVRQYYTDGFYPSGIATHANALTPSAALLKATLIASARPATIRRVGTNGSKLPLPTPSYEQGWGFPVLDNALYFPGDAAKLRVVDAPLSAGLVDGESSTLRVRVGATAPLRVVLVWTDPPGVPRSVNDTTPELVNDLDLRVTTSAATYFGNGASPDRLNNVEAVLLAQPAAGTYDITVTAHHLGIGPRQSYALVISGDVSTAPVSRQRAVRH
jgi:hypothetical protein